LAVHPHIRAPGCGRGPQAGPAAPPLLLEALDAWAGRSHSATLADALLLHIADADAFEAVANSPRLGPYLLDIPGPGWLIVSRERRKEFVGLLEHLGFTVGKDLVPGPTPRPREGERTRGPASQ
jgi:hypothetical protein